MTNDDQHENTSWCVVEKNTQISAEYRHRLLVFTLASDGTHQFMVTYWIIFKSLYRVIHAVSFYYM